MLYYIKTTYLIVKYIASSPLDGDIFRFHFLILNVWLVLQVRKEQDRHSELVQTYNEKQRTVQPFMNPIAGNPQPGGGVAQVGGKIKFFESYK